MSLLPKGHDYKCTTCGHEFIKHVTVFTVVPCMVKCTQCGIFAAELTFPTIKEKHDAQLYTVRRAGQCLSESAQELRSSIIVKHGPLGKKVEIDEATLELALGKLARAGECLGNLPK